MRILNIIATVNPSGGGPIEWVRQFSAGAVRLGHQVEILTMDSNTDAFIHDFVVPVHPAKKSLRGFYSPGLTPWLRQNARRFDAIIIHGLWRYQSIGAWRALKESGLPYYVFVHGMLGEYFTRQKFKHFVKSIYWSLTDFYVLRDAEAVLFTCEEERRFAKHSFRRYCAKEIVAPLGLRLPRIEPHNAREKFFMRYPELREKRLVLFLGRLVPIKGCDTLLDAFSQVAFQYPTLHLVMAGPDQDGWQQQLVQQAKILGVAERITWTGMLDNEERWQTIHAAEVMVMPSHHENFSYATVEGLACGVPSILSEHVGIWREIQTAGAGLVGRRTAAGFAQLLRDWLNMSVEKKLAMRTRSQACFRQHFEIEQAVKHVIDIIQLRSNTNMTSYDYRYSSSGSL